MSKRGFFYRRTLFLCWVPMLAVGPTVPGLGAERRVCPGKIAKAGRVIAWAPSRAHTRRKVGARCKRLRIWKSRAGVASVSGFQRNEVRRKGSKIVGGSQL